MTIAATTARTTAALRTVTLIAGIWAFLYALYRGFYAFGGTAAMPGTLRPGAGPLFQSINIAATIALLLAAATPFILRRLWPTRARVWCVVTCWIVAVGCCMHALIDMIQRILSLAGIFQVSYPASLWASVNTRTADYQDLFANEPWFLIEGLLFAVLAGLNLAPRERRVFLLTALGAVAVAVALGLLAATGHLPRLVIF